jgi:hypothetical protein
MKDLQEIALMKKKIALLWAEAALTREKTALIRKETVLLREKTALVLEETVSVRDDIVALLKNKFDSTYENSDENSSICENSSIDDENSSIDDENSKEEWEELKANNKYEINRKFPHQIRNKKTHRVLKQYKNKKTGYYQLTAEKPVYPHVLIAKQFIPNPLHLAQVNHINHVRDDNRIANLEWVSVSQNNRSKASHFGIEYEWLDRIGERAMKVLDYISHRFAEGEYFFHNDVFYYYNGIQYRALRLNRAKGCTTDFVCMINKDGKTVKVNCQKFKKLHQLF